MCLGTHTCNAGSREVYCIYSPAVDGPPEGLMAGLHFAIRKSDRRIKCICSPDCEIGEPGPSG